MHRYCTGDINALRAFIDSMAPEEGDNSRLQYMINVRNDLKYTPLHVAIFQRSIETVELLIQHGADVNAKCFITPPLHLALTTALLPEGRDFGLECFELLINSGANVLAKDDQGFTVMHIAAESNMVEALNRLFQDEETASELLLAVPSVVDRLTPLHKAAVGNATEASTALLSAGASVFRSDSISIEALRVVANMDSVGCDSAVATLQMLTAVNEYGMTALHFAAQNSSSGVWHVLISALKSTLSKKACKEVFDSKVLESVQLETTSIDLAYLCEPLDSAGKFLDAMINSACSIVMSRGWSISKDFSELTPPSCSTAVPTAILSSKYCLRHHTCPPSELLTSGAPPENVKRLMVLINDHAGALRTAELQALLTWETHCKEDTASISDVLRVHEWSYVRQVQHRCESIQSLDPEEQSGFAHLDGDTAISKDTYKAAVAAAGVVCRGVDLVLNQEVRNAFCPIRPPGHHAGTFAL